MDAPGVVRSIHVDDVPWRPSTMAPGIFVKDVAVTHDVYSDTGCVFVLVDLA